MEYHPDAIKSMNAWIPALSTAFLHSILLQFKFPSMTKSSFGSMV